MFAFIQARMEAIKVLIVDDHQIMIDGLKKCINPLNDLEVCGELLSGTSVVDFLDNHPSDVILLDISMPEKSGLEVAKEIKKIFPDQKIIMLTMHDDLKNINEAIQLGVDGYILKNTGVEELEKAIKRVYNGQKYFSDEVSAKVINEINSEAGKNGSRRKTEIRLTRREKQIVDLILEEFTSSEIGEKLNISSATVETHRKNIMKKADVRNTAGLVKWALNKN